MRVTKSLSAFVLCALAVHLAALPSAAAGEMTLELDASEAPRRILHARLVIPAAPGPLKLFYPKWIPGEHGPSGPVTDLVGLELRAGGKVIPWRRDDLDMYTIHCQVPQGAGEVEVKLDHVDTGGGGFTGGGSSTANLAVISWNHVLLYPEGRPVREIVCRPSIRLPPGWKLGSALPVEPQQGQAPDAPTVFQPVSLETLVDSPVICGLHYRDVNIGPKGVVSQHTISMAADSEAALRMAPELKANYDRLVSEAAALFGGRRYQSYRFLLCLSDHVEPFGLEHHASSDNRVPERTLLDDKMRKSWSGALLPHEFAHAWNGKYRRPADMVAPTFQEPLRTRMLWVYEGLTEYLGIVLASRSGVWTPERTREVLAAMGAAAHDRKGRAWRPLDDTAASAQLLFNAKPGWEHWRRGVDFYDEGALVWLEIDTVIRHNTRGQRSLDDFCRRFFAGGVGDPPVKPYTLDDVVADLDAVAPYDWRTFLSNRIADVAPEPPMNGIRNGGWRLGFGEEPSEFQAAREEEDESVDELATLGLVAKSEDGRVLDVVPDKPAHRAGLAPGMKVVAVNGRRFSTDVLRDAIGATKEGDGRIELLCENADFFRPLTLEYKGGRKYPRLERDETKPDLLTAILRPAAGDGR
jgi:predicted metalloprotease with PDZ domain